MVKGAQNESEPALDRKSHYCSHTATHHVKCMFGSIPASFIFVAISNVRSLVLPPAPHVMSAYRGSVVHTGMGEEKPCKH